MSQSVIHVFEIWQRFGKDLKHFKIVKVKGGRQGLSSRLVIKIVVIASPSAAGVYICDIFCIVTVCLPASAGSPRTKSESQTSDEGRRAIQLGIISRGQRWPTFITCQHWLSQSYSYQLPTTAQVCEDQPPRNLHQCISTLWLDTSQHRGRRLLEICLDFKDSLPPSLAWIETNLKTILQEDEFPKVNGFQFIAPNL